MEPVSIYIITPIAIKIVVKVTIIVTTLIVVKKTVEKAAEIVENKAAQTKTQSFKKLEIQEAKRGLSKETNKERRHREQKEWDVKRKETEEKKLGQPPVNEPGWEEQWEPPRNWNGEKKKVPNDKSKERGYPHKNGDVWVPNNKGHGGADWEVQYKDGKGHHHVYPDGEIRRHKNVYKNGTIRTTDGTIKQSCFETSVQEMFDSKLDFRSRSSLINDNFVSPKSFLNVRTNLPPMGPKGIDAVIAELTATSFSNSNSCDKNNNGNNLPPVGITGGAIAAVAAGIGSIGVTGVAVAGIAAGATIKASNSNSHNERNSSSSNNHNSKNSYNYDNWSVPEHLLIPLKRLALVNEIKSDQVKKEKINECYESANLFAPKARNVSTTKSVVQKQIVKDNLEKHDIFISSGDVDKFYRAVNNKGERGGFSEAIDFAWKF